MCFTLIHAISTTVAGNNKTIIGGLLNTTTTEDDIYNSATASGGGYSTTFTMRGQTLSGRGRLKSLSRKRCVLGIFPQSRHSRAIEFGERESCKGFIPAVGHVAEHGHRHGFAKDY